MFGTIDGDPFEADLTNFIGGEEGYILMGIDTRAGLQIVLTLSSSAPGTYSVEDGEASIILTHADEASGVSYEAVSGTISVIGTTDSAAKAQAGVIAEIINAELLKAFDYYDPQAITYGVVENMKFLAILPVDFPELDQYSFVGCNFSGFPPPVDGDLKWYPIASDRFHFSHGSFVEGVLVDLGFVSTTFDSYNNIDYGASDDSNVGDLEQPGYDITLTMLLAAEDIYAQDLYEVGYRQRPEVFQDYGLQFILHLESEETEVTLNTFPNGAGFVLIAPFDPSANAVVGTFAATFPDGTSCSLGGFILAVDPLREGKRFSR